MPHSYEKSIFIIMIIIIGCQILPKRNFFFFNMTIGATTEYSLKSIVGNRQKRHSRWAIRVWFTRARLTDAPCVDIHCYQLNLSWVIRRGLWNQYQWVVNSTTAIVCWNLVACTIGHICKSKVPQVRSIAHVGISNEAQAKRTTSWAITITRILNQGPDSCLKIFWRNYRAWLVLLAREN